MSRPTHVLYLHGFRSSPQSFKARVMGAHLSTHNPQVHWWCPQLPASPKAAIEQLTNTLAHWPQGRMAVVGSSLGGFYATWVAQRYDCPAVLLNPAVNPARDLETHIGKQTQWHAPEEDFYFHREYVQELQALTVPAITKPKRYLAVIAKGDEVLDWHEMNQRYADCNQRLLEGGDHALSDFTEHLPAVLQFLDLA